MQIYKRNKGITLVALIITIIILLILAGVSLSFVFNGGILDKSQQAVNEYQNAANNESDVLEYINETLDKKLNEIGEGSGGGPGETPSVDEDGLATENTTIVAKDDSSIQIVIPKGFAPAILQTGTTQSLPGENGAVKEIMPAEEWNNITKEDINRGIVVVDNAITYDGGQALGTLSDFNEYVWIPMPDSSKFARVAWNGLYWNEGLKNGTHILMDKAVENAFWEDKTADYKNMLNSVSNNKGFYISRYEASKKDDTTAQSKRGQNPCMYITQLDSVVVSSNMNKNINSHLIYGIEWDSVLQWLLDSEAKIGVDTVGGDLKTITIDDIQSDSRSWGNYKNSVGGAAVNSGTRQVGGKNEYWKVNNIYDLAGNVSEWSQEQYSTDIAYSIRGGDFASDDDSGPVAYRSIHNKDSSYYDARF